MKVISLNSFIYEALCHYWSIQSISLEREQLLVTMIAVEGELTLKFDAQNFSEDTVIEVYRGTSLVMNERAGLVGFSYNSIGTKLESITQKEN